VLGRHRAVRARTFRIGMRRKMVRVRFFCMTAEFRLHIWVPVLTALLVAVLFPEVGPIEV